MEGGHLQPSEQAEALVFARCYGKFNKSRQDRWVFGDRQSGAYMHKFAWTRILRHWTVKHGASLDDATLAGCWAWQRRKALLPINKTTQKLTNSQAICRGGWNPSHTRRMPTRTRPDLRDPYEAIGLA